MPSIIRMLYYIRRPMQKVALTKKNILLRDDYTCQYCGLKGERMMTVDHVLPRSKGGPSTWENLVCACMRCNNRKNNRTPEHANMLLKRKPKAPKYIPWIRVKRNTLPGEWHKFLFLYNVSIEEHDRSLGGCSGRLCHGDGRVGTRRCSAAAPTGEEPRARQASDRSRSTRAARAALERIARERVAAARRSSAGRRRRCGRNSIDA